MTGRLISDSLAREKRLTIPRLGTFVHRPQGGIAFTRLQTDDENTLAEIVSRSENVSSDKAKEAIDRFVRSVRETTSAGRKYPVSGLGWFYADPQGIVRFEYDPSVGDEAMPGKPAGPSAEAAQPTAPVRVAPTAQSRPYDSRPAGGPARPQERRPNVQPHPLTEPEIRRPQHEAAKQELPTTPDSGTERINIRRPGRRKADRTIILAVIALIIALGVLLYGYFAKPSAELVLQDTEQVDAPSKQAE